MATVTTKFSPIHERCQVGYPYRRSRQPAIVAGYHTGCDFPQSGVATTNPDLYSCVEDGEVVYIYNNATGPRRKSSAWKSSSNKR